MRVLVACEFSGRIRDAFARKGHLAVSCDLLPSEKAGVHYQGDVREIAEKYAWDLLIANPPCTYLARSGLHWNKKGIVIDGRTREELTEEALDFVRYLMNLPIEKIAVENPVSCISTRIRRPDQIVQPWWFGEDASKATCLWLKGLPHLVPTSERPGRRYCYYCGVLFKEVGGTHCHLCNRKGSRKLFWANQTPSGQNKVGGKDDRWKERSRTYLGLAQAMADQWG